MQSSGVQEDGGPERWLVLGLSSNFMSLWGVLRSVNAAAPPVTLVKFRGEGKHFLLNNRVWRILLLVLATR